MVYELSDGLGWVVENGPMAMSESYGGAALDHSHSRSASAIVKLKIQTILRFNAMV